MKRTRLVLAMILVVVMLFTTMVPAVALTDDNRSVRTTRTFSPGERETQSINEKKIDSLKKLGQETSRFEKFNVDENAEVTVIVTLEGDAAVKGETDINSRAAQAKRAVLKAKQDSFFGNLGFDATLDYNYTVLFNGIAITTAFKNVAAIEGMKGVSGVYLSNTYEAPAEMPEMDFANLITGASMVHDLGFDGDGIVVAVLDTGLTVGHEAFADYGLVKNPALTEEKVAQTATEKAGAYLSAKVPFAYDYFDMDTDVSDSNGHGTHVSGIATGYVEAEDDAVTFSGGAPAAQLLAMKVFSSDPNTSGTNSSVYFAALEDAYLLGADVINMSLGAPGGFTFDAELETELYGNIYKTLDDAGVIVCVSAGNEYSMGYNSLNWADAEAVLADYADYGTVGSPSTYSGNLSVASVENTAYPAYCIKLGEMLIPFNDSCEDGTHGFLDTFMDSELQYVVVPGLGTAADYTVLNVTGKLALVQRGEITFEEKVQNAAEAGAIGIIIYNNQAGQIGLLIDTYEVPAVAIEQAHGEALVAAATDGIGTINVPADKEIVDNVNAGKMSDFSGWGTTSDLKLKPQITAPGGMIYSSVNGGSLGEPFMLGDVNRVGGIDSADASAILRHVVRLALIPEEDLFYGDVDQNGNTDSADASAILRWIVKLQDLPMYTPENGSAYDVYSGTSMSSPNAAGAIAAMIQAGRKSMAQASKKEVADNVESRILSTAEIIYDSDDYPYSPRKQGTGELNIWNAGANAYILDPIKELGDDPEKTGVYSFAFTVNNDLPISVSFEIEAIGLYDYIVALGEAEDATYYNTLTSDYLDAELITNCPNNIVTVPAAGQAEVTVTLTLSQEQKDLFDEQCVNGAFVEGFVVLSNNMEATIHATFLAFYGDWAQGSILEKYDYTDVANAETWLNTTAADEEGNTYADYGYGADALIEMNIGYNEAYAYGDGTGAGAVGILGDNPVDYLDHNAAHNAISNETSNSSYLADLMLTYPTQLRNARHLIMVVTDAATGEVYLVDDTPYLSKSYYDEDQGMYLQSGTFYWDGTNQDGEYVPSGTKAIAKYYAWLDYDTEAEAALTALDGDYSQLSDEHLVWQVPITVDSTAPVVTLNNWDAATKALTVTVTDETYLAGVMLYDPEYNALDGYAYSDDLVGQSHQIVFNLSEVEADKVIVSPIDYATNWPDFSFDMATGELVEVVPASFTPINDICIEIYLEDMAESYTTRGVVTLIDGKNVYIASLLDDQLETDVFSGICVYCAEAPTNIGVGDVILTTGVPTVYKGLYELKDATIDEVLYTEDGESWSYFWNWTFTPIADVIEYASELACSPVAYGMDDEGNDLIGNGLTIVSVAANTAAGYWDMVVTDGTTEMPIYKCPTPAEGIDKFLPGAIIGGYMVVGIFNTPQFRIALPSDIWILQESTATPTPTPSSDPSGLPYFTNELTSNGVDFMVGQTTETIITATGAANPATAAIYNNESISVSPWHGIASFNAETGYTYIYFTADLTEQTGVKLAGSFSGNNRVPTAFKAEYKIGEGNFVSLGDISLDHAAGVAPAAAANWSFDVPTACEGQAAVTFRVRQTASATAKADNTSTSDAGALYISGFGLTNGSTPTPTPSGDPTPTPSTDPTPTPTAGSGLTAGNYYISTQVGGVTYYMTATVVNNKFSSTTVKADAAVWTVAASSTGYTLANGGQFVAYTGTASSGKTNIALGETAEVWTWDATNSRLLSTTIAERALAVNGGNNNVFGNYAISNAASDTYGFTITFTPAA